MSRISPKVSAWTSDRFPKKGEALKIVNLYDVMKHCEQISPDATKGHSGSIFPYVSDTVNPNHLSFDGVVFVDIDKCKDVSNEIYDVFEKICEYLPNLLALNFSYSHNLHCYFYDEDVQTKPSLYGERAMLYLCAFAAAVKHITGIDLRDYEGALDTHSKSPNQRLFLNYSPFKWNIYCCKATISQDDTKRLKAEYFSLYKVIEERRSLVETKPIIGKGKITINQDYNLLGYGTGYEARTLIAAAVYKHFDNDIYRARCYLSEHFENAEEINIQMTSMVNNDRIAYKYRKDVEDFLFGLSISEEIELDSNQWLSDVVNLSKINSKYIYLQANTGTGKTEFVKSLIKNSNDKVIYVQITRALRDGKKHTIEEHTHENWAYDIGPKDKVHMSLDGAVKYLHNIYKDLPNYLIIVDESHLLEDYINIRENLTNDFLHLLRKANRVLFMSATPKTDIKLFAFDKICYIRKQAQDILIHRHPISISGNGRKNPTIYGYITQWIKAQKNKVIVFSDKKQKEWKANGLGCDGVTYFNANNITDIGVQAILKENKLINHVTLSTQYMGCGVEVKNEKEVDIVFYLNEGFSISSIIQSIGRPRSSGGVEKINVHFFYTIDCKFRGYLNDSDKYYLNNAFDNLSVNTKEGETINIIAAHMVGIWDSGFRNWSESEKIRNLKIANIIGSHNFFSPYSANILSRLPYRSVKIKNYSIIELDTSGQKTKHMVETELIDYLCSLTPHKISALVGEDGYDYLFDKGLVPFVDKTNARKTIQQARFIVNHYIDLKKALSFFGTLEKAVRYIKAIFYYASTTLNESAIKNFKGGEIITSKIENDIEKAKLIFTDEYIKKIAIYRGALPFSEYTCIDDIFEPNADLDKIMAYDRLQEEIIDNANYGLTIFRGSTYKECVDVHKMKKLGGASGSKKGKSVGGRKGGQKTFAIKIQKVDSGEILNFDSKTECMKFLGWSSKKFSEFVKNKTDKKNTYIIL